MSPPRCFQLRKVVAASVAVAALSWAAPASAHDRTLPESGVEIAAGGLTVFDSMSCPVTDHEEFADSWGDRRSGGRRHEGVDIAAERGTPTVAALAGFAEFKNTSAGGKSVWLTTPDGHKFFYAHLDAWEGESRDVEQGDVIGYVGSTGNAGGPHLHFEVRPDGAAVNPYPATSAACQRQQSAATNQSEGRAGSPGLLMIM